MLIIDTHVHIHDCFALERFFGSAYDNFSAVAADVGATKNFHGILMLTESRNTNRFAALATLAEGKRLDPDFYSHRWRVSPTGEEVSLTIHDRNQRSFFVIAGRQVVTEEKLEVLALFVAGGIEDGLPIREVLLRVKASAGLPVLPWGFGKWAGRRGNVLDRLLKESEKPLFFIGDNSGRPSFLPEPQQFGFAQASGIIVLPGSDPLPFPSEVSRAGRFGCCIDAEISERHPARDLRNIFAAPGLVVHSYGRLETPFNFVRNQIKMQLWKRQWIAS